MNMRALLSKLFNKKMSGVKIRCTFSSILLLCWSSPLFSATNDIMYVTDALEVDLRSGPTNAYRFIGRLTSGTKITVLEHDVENKTTHVELGNGKTGWIQTAFLVNNSGAVEQLENVTKELVKLKKEATNHSLLQSEKQKQINALTKQYNSLQGQVTELQNKLEIEQQKYLRLSDNKRFEPFYMGGIVAFVGLFIGLFLGRTRKKHDGWN